MYNSILFSKFSPIIYKKYDEYNKKNLINFPDELKSKYYDYALYDYNFPRPLLTLLGINYNANTLDEINLNFPTDNLIFIPQILRDSFAIVDDVLDGDIEKFGKPTIPVSFSKYFNNEEINILGQSVAILFGDYLMGTLYKFIENLDTNSEEKLDIYSLVNNVIINTTLAEINGMLLQKKALHELSKNEILKLYECKAADYCYAFPYELGLIHSHAPLKLKNEIREILLKIGVLSQVIDDLIGIFPEAIDNQKNTISDLLKMRRTFILVYFYETNKKENIKNILEKNTCNEKDALLIKKEMIMSGFIKNINNLFSNEITNIKDKINNISIGEISKEYLLNTVDTRITKTYHTILKNIDQVL